jgi:histidinol-phosphate aminotransferase
MAGARLGFGIAQKELICDLETLRYSTNPYNVNSMTLAMGKAVLDNDVTTKERCKKIIENREWTKARLSELGFEFPDSKANFVFARHPEISGEDVYKKLREKGVLVRHFSSERICDYNRITIGSLDDMKVLIGALREILEEK